jgi:hypothetical protein
MTGAENTTLEWVKTLDVAGLSLLALWLGARGTWVFGSVHSATVVLYEKQMAKAEASLAKKERECEEYSQLVRAWANTAHEATSVARKAMEHQR